MTALKELDRVVLKSAVLPMAARQPVVTVESSQLCPVSKCEIKTRRNYTPPELPYE